MEIPIRMKKVVRGYEEVVITKVRLLEQDPMRTFERLLKEIVKERWGKLEDDHVLLELVGPEYVLVGICLS